MCCHHEGHLKQVFQHHATIRSHERAFHMLDRRTFSLFAPPWQSLKLVDSSKMIPSLSSIVPVRQFLSLPPADLPCFKFDFLPSRVWIPLALLPPSPWNIAPLQADNLLIDKHISLSVDPVHPDLDIQPTGSFTIQIGLPTIPFPSPHASISSSPEFSRLLIQTDDRALVYRPDGRFIGSLSPARLAWLRSRYDHFSTSSPDLFGQHSTGSFEQDIAALLIRYRPRDKCPDYNGINHPHWPLHADTCSSLHRGLHVSSYHFSTPLTVPIDDVDISYSTHHPQDCIFGAYHATYSHPWTGSSIVCPPFSATAIQKALRWAIASATHCDSPSSTLIVIPKWYVTRLNYWVHHPYVSTLDSHIHDTSPLFRKGTPLFTPPDHLLHNPTLSVLPARTDMALLHVCNPSGYTTYMLSHSSIPPTPLPPASGAWPVPSGFYAALRAQHNLPTAPATLSPTTLHITSIYPAAHPPTWFTRHAFYTDGASQTISNRTRAGASFYETHQCASHPPKLHLVCPAGRRETNTITRAELSAIAAALTHASQHIQRPSITIFTDSLVSIYLILQALHSPTSLIENKHAPLVLHIRSLLLARARLSYRTHIQKVTSHAGITGNELADIGATRALTSEAFDYTLSHVDNQYLSSLHAWPCLPPPAEALTEDIDPEPWFFSNLHDAVSNHIHSIPTVTDGHIPPTHSKTYHRNQSINQISLPLYNNHYFHSSSWGTIKSILKIRSGSYWTASRAATIHKPYRIATGSHTTPNCPLCSHLHASSPPLDTAGHILGACPLLSAPIISRHNRAVCLLYRHISLGSFGGHFTILDATSRRSLPPGVMSTRIPSWILPDVDLSTLARLRPDILIIHGLSHSLFASLRPSLESPDPSVSLLALRSLQRTCTVHIVELGYTSDRSLASSVTRKRHQHNLLAHFLLTAGLTLPSNCPPNHLTLLPPLTCHLMISPPRLTHLCPRNSPKTCLICRLASTYC